MSDKKVMSPHEAEVDRLLQIMAVLLEKLGGEILISRSDLEAFFDVPVLGRVISKDYLLLRLGFEDEVENIEMLDLPEENPQT